MRIVSRRLVVRPFVPRDVTEEYLGWLNDKELMRYSRQRFLAHTRTTCISYLHSFDPPDGFWNVETLDGTQVGTLTTYVRGDSADIGVLVGRGGQGYGTEAFGAALFYLFESVGVRQATAGAAVENVAMIKVAARWQMRLRKLDGGYYWWALSRARARGLDFSGYAISGTRLGAGAAGTSPRASSSSTNLSSR